MLGIKIFRLIFIMINFAIMIGVTDDQRTFFVGLLIYSSNFLCDYLLKENEAYLIKEGINIIIYGIGIAIAFVLVLISVCGLVGSLTIVYSEISPIIITFSENYLFKSYSFDVFNIMLGLVILLALEFAVILREVALFAIKFIQEKHMGCENGN